MLKNNFLKHKINVYIIIIFIISLLFVIILLIFKAFHTEKINEINNVNFTVIPQITQKNISIITPNINTTITLSTEGFIPSKLFIKKGEIVYWINKIGQDATINSDPHPIHTDYLPLNIGVFIDKQIVSLQFNKVGTYSFHNHYDSTQKGTIVVSP